MTPPRPKTDPTDPPATYRTSPLEQQIADAVAKTACLCTFMVGLGSGSLGAIPIRKPNPLCPEHFPPAPSLEQQAEGGPRIMITGHATATVLKPDGTPRYPEATPDTKE